MVQIRTIPTHEYVKSVDPEKGGPFELAFGRAVEKAITTYNRQLYNTGKHEHAYKKAIEEGSKVFRQELEKRNQCVTLRDVDAARDRLRLMLSLWSRSPYTRSLMPDPHVIILERGGLYFGLYAKPDLCNGREFYEVKSFDIMRQPRQHVWVQADVFSLLGPLRILYFSENGGMLYELREYSFKPSRDLNGLLEDLWIFATRYRGPNLKLEELRQVKKKRPFVQFSHAETGWRRVAEKRWTRITCLMQ